ncbi:hypothetical protein GQ44DRAFT_688166 [Phaeosphaeriaceae sp. PMI808]|nr:hypothetical protein GQ44DRAFT_688166 [Phaeosphaeriaceae sp. PMI808]
MSVFIRIFRNKWITPPKPVHEDYSGRNIIVTGATSGIGVEAAYKFAALGASKVIIAARDLKKGESTKAALEARLQKTGQLEVWELDMMSYPSIRAFAKRTSELDHIDIAVLNAGVRRSSFVSLNTGWEEDLQINTLSTALLALELLPLLRESKRHTGKTPILEIVNSGLHQSAVVPTEVQNKPNILAHYNNKANFTENNQYKFSKVFLMYVTRHLASKVSSEDIIITSICPGMVNTNLARDHQFPGMYVLFFLVTFLFMRTSAQGANMILSGTTQGEMVHGRFWQHDKIQPIPLSLKGETMEQLQFRMFGEIIEALEKDVPDVRAILDNTLSSWHAAFPFVPETTLPFYRRKPSAFLRFLFPRTRARARDHLSKLRHETFPSLKHHAQSRIYRYILHRQSLKLKRKPSILQRLRGHTRRLVLGSSSLENEVRLRRREIAKDTGNKELGAGAMSYQDNGEPRESGRRRQKFAGYLKAANELRQTYTQQYAPSWRGNEENYKFEDDTPGEFPDAAVVRSGEEEMILFPSYARKHIKRMPEAEPGTIQEEAGEGRDVRDSTGAGDAEFWKKQWEDYEDDKAVVDVDVRGWIYSPFKGQMSRKQRLFIGLARQLVGVQAPAAGANEQTSAASSRDPSPGHPTRDGYRERQAQRDEQLAAKEAEHILRKGEQEAEVAAKGRYSEKPSRGDSDETSLYRAQSRDSVHTMGSLKPGQLSHTASQNSLRGNGNTTPLKKRQSWTHPDEMNASELAEANARLMARLRHFLAVPMANTPISIFFYNEQISKQRTIYTNASGHFNMTAALDFVPTHVRILASDKLSATEEVIVTSAQGISVISDIDDTIKHSAISSGAREIFRNAFIRELGDLTIDGVREWYKAMADLGVKFHYVSNSPWQLYPVISKYFAQAGLPPGSFHLKQYSGMLQGIFEPVAERKKVTLDKIARDFPERNFILIGDSGEADLEVYTDFVLENPGRVVAVFIRDVTTSDHGGFFGHSVGPISRDQSSSSSPSREASMRAAATSRGRPLSEEHDPELKAAIAASLRHFDEDDRRRSTSIFPQMDKDHPELRPRLPDRKPSSNSTTATTVPNLIDLSSDDERDTLPIFRRTNTDSKLETQAHRTSLASTTSPKPAPPPPKKPASLRSPSGDSLPFSTKPPPPPPPKPRIPSNTVNNPSPLSQNTSAATRNTSAKPPIPPKFQQTTTAAAADEQSYAGLARDKLWSVYNHLPALRSTTTTHANTNTHPDTDPDTDTDAKRTAPPPPPPPRRTTTAAATAVPQSVHRTHTASTMGMNGEQGGMNKREQMWRARLSRAEEVMGEKGVVLRVWRVGRDVVGVAERVIRGLKEGVGVGWGEVGQGRVSSSMVV